MLWKAGNIRVTVRSASGVPLGCHYPLCGYVEQSVRCVCRARYGRVLRTEDGQRGVSSDEGILGACGGRDRIRIGGHGA
jgi:hypothetical protein